MKEAIKIITKVLGKSSAEYFETQVEDFLCYVHSEALVDVKSPIPQVKDKIEKVVLGLIENTVKHFLIEKFGTTEEGSMRVIIEDNKIYDENGILIPEIPKLLKAKPKIMDSMLDLAIDEFEKGRGLAMDITQRARKFNTDTTTKGKKQDRDYITWPAFEFIEIEILRLEKKLPGLSPEEGRRLCSLYEKQHDQESLEQEINSFEVK